ncbi:MAG: hypothetical protein GX062_08035 [Firmicutes bacterium]|nr:hypothetical protein [Bacillota bacterium]
MFVARRKRSAISQTRSVLYGLARLLGDIQAVSKGPKAMAKRAGRRLAGKATGRALGRLFK